MIAKIFLELTAIYSFMQYQLAPVTVILHTKYSICAGLVIWLLCFAPLACLRFLLSRL